MSEFKKNKISNTPPVNKAKKKVSVPKYEEREIN